MYSREKEEAVREMSRPVALLLPEAARSGYCMQAAASLSLTLTKLKQNSAARTSSKRPSLAEADSTPEIDQAEALPKATDTADIGCVVCKLHDSGISRPRWLHRPKACGSACA